jgi:very-short-patch-repair endonuclease
VRFMLPKVPTHLKQNSRKLRQNQTPWEHRLWYYLRNRRFFNLKFKRQVRIGNYIVDFCCSEKRLVIELDGSQHAQTEINQKDFEKARFIKSQKYTVLHIWNNEIDENLQGVLERVCQLII